MTEFKETEMSEDTTLKLEIGKYYERRDGEIVGPVEPNDHDMFPFEAVDDRFSESYTPQGFCYSKYRPDGSDLIREVPAPVITAAESVTSGYYRMRNGEVTEIVKEGDSFKSAEGWNFSPSSGLLTKGAVHHDDLIEYLGGDEASLCESFGVVLSLPNADYQPLAVLPDSGERSEFSTGAVRDASIGKGLPSCLPTDSLRVLSCHFERGAQKYGRDNWTQGIPYSRYIDALNRHLWAFQEGKVDEPHLVAVAWNAICLLATAKRVQLGDLPKELCDIAIDPDHANLN
jgi:hypothetical protein